MKEVNKDLVLKGKKFKAPFLYKHSNREGIKGNREYIITECYDNFVMAKQLDTGVPTSFTYTDLREFGVISVDEWQSWVSNRSADNILM